MSDTVCIRMSGDCTVRAIRTLHGEIVAGLASATDLVLDCNRHRARRHHHFVQLVVSAAGTAERQAKRLTLVDVPAAVQGAFARAGLTPQGPFARAA